MIRGQIWNVLVNLLGTGSIQRTELGRLVCLYSQIGGGGKEGAEHAKSFSATWNLVFNTTTHLLNQILKFVQVCQLQTCYCLNTKIFIYIFFPVNI